MAVAKRVSAALSRPVFPDRRRLLDCWESQGLQSVAEDVLRSAEESLTDVHDRVATEIERAKSDLDEAWSARKLELVPGHELLDRVASRYGVRFSKERDAVDVAARIPKSRLPRELILILEGACLTGSAR